MDVNKEIIHISHQSDIPKYQQIVTSIIDAVSKNNLTKGSALPSVNAICKLHRLSRDTVFKAYSILKDYGIVQSVPNKGYFIADETKKVLLVLDTFKAYKEVLYHSFINHIPENIITDVQFHHYKIDNFKAIINNSIGKYYKYIIMNFDDPQVMELIGKLDKQKLLLIDWNIHADKDHNFVGQDFGRSFFESLKEAIPLFKKYRRIDFLYPTFTYHPKETIRFFERFCEEYGFTYRIFQDPKKFAVEKNVAYISVSDRMLGNFLEQCKNKKLEPGQDAGFLSYNETPTKKFIYKGISVVSTDFTEMGAKAAEFVAKNEAMQHYVPTKLIIRESL